MINLNVNRLQSIRDDIERGDGLVEFTAQAIAIGGGGAAGGGGYYPGGGAGGFISASWVVPPKSTFDVTIGRGGILNTAAGDTTVVLTATSETYFDAKGGGEGYNAVPASVDGGSGGGGGLVNGIAISSSLNVPNGTLVISPTGHDGGGTSSPGSGNGGGGVLGPGVGQTGGPGINITGSFLNGLLPGVTELAGGGDGKTSPAGAASVEPSGSGMGATAGTDQGHGGSGLFAIHYEGEPKATGGTITTSGGYTTHVFTGSGQFITTGKSNNNP